MNTPTYNFGKYSFPPTYNYAQGVFPPYNYFQDKMWEEEDYPVSSTEEVLDENSAKVHDAPKKGHQYEKIELNPDVVPYVRNVECKFRNQPQLYKDFLDILYEFSVERIDRFVFVQRASSLFRGYPELIVGLYKFLPHGFRIEIQPNEQVRIIIPGVSMRGSNTDYTTLIIPSEPPITTPIHPTHNFQSNQPSQTTSPHSSPGNK